MGFFTAGNLLTLGIALLILVLFRYMDKNNRHKRGLSDYSDKLKKDLAAFMEEQEKAIKDYAIALNVERDSARELFKRLQLTEEELAGKAEAITKIESQIKSYENSLAELDKMTSRVQENMSRVREESAFVESTGKRLSEVKNRLEGMGKEFQTLESRFEQKNTDALKQAVESIFANAKATASDLSATLETIERQVDEHRQEINKIEHKRATDMARDMEHINKILKTAVENAGERASKIEDAALANLREQAEDRIRRLKTAEEERLRSYQESAKARVADVQSQIAKFQEEWQAERAGWENQDKTLRDERLKDIQELNALLEESEKRLVDAKAAFEEQMREHSEQTGRMLSSQEAMLLKSAEEMRQKTLEMTGSTLEAFSGKWQAERAAWETGDQALRDKRAKDMQEFNAALEDSERRLAISLEDSEKRLIVAKAAFETQMQEFAERTGQMLSSQEAMLLKSTEEMRQKTLEMTGEKLEEYRGEWQAERVGWENQDKALRDKRAKDMQEFNASLEESEKRLGTAKADFEKQMQEFAVQSNQMFSSQGAMLAKAAEDMKHKALEITETKLEEYRQAQDAEFRRLEALADDSNKLDEELRRSMQEVAGKIQEDFSRYERESADARKTEFGKFSATAATIRKEMAEIERELTALKSAAYDNVSEKLKGFEEDFFADLSRRSGELDQRLLKWQDDLETRLSRMGEEAEAGRRELERGLTEDMRKQLSAQDARLVSSLERLKEETSVFGERIRGEINAADESVNSLKEQLAGNFEEARNTSEIYIKAEIGKHSLAAAETIKQHQRELDGKLREMADYIQTRNGEVSLLIDASRAELAEAKGGIAGKVRELDDSIEDARRRVRDLTADTDSRIALVRSSVEDTERHIREAVDQTKIIDKAEALRLDLAQRIEDLNSDMDRQDQRRAEVAQLENEFVKIKRQLEDVNGKMTRFISEKRKIETMEADFSRLIKISYAVEEKLTHVTASHDTLQGMELQLRKLEEALATTDEKFLRIDRKNQILDNTADGIDRNFRILQESEKLSAKIGGELGRHTEDLSSIKTSIERLSGESEKARQAVDKIEMLDELLQEIEERIKSMQGARQWLANAETRLEELNRQAQTQARHIDNLLKGKESRVSPIPRGGTKLSPQQLKEDVFRLIRQGWTDEEIALSMKISQGEVQLYREMMPRD